MTQTTKDTMRAAAIDKFGGPETIALHTLPVPQVDRARMLRRCPCSPVPFPAEHNSAP